MKLSKSVKRRMTAVLATGALMVSMVGCGATTEQSSLDELTITHVTSPLNVPSIIQKIKICLKKLLKQREKMLL